MNKIEKYYFFNIIYTNRKTRENNGINIYSIIVQLFNN